MDTNWTLPPLTRRPIKTTITKRFTVGVLWPVASTPDFDIADLDDHELWAKAVEAAGLDFVLITDGYTGGTRTNRSAVLRSMVTALPIIMSTTSIGVVTTLRTMFTHPTQIARFGSHLDWLSNGRWGWCVAMGAADEADLYGIEAWPSLEDQHAMAAESIDAVRQIWGAGPDGVDIAGRFFRISGRAKRPQVIQRPGPLLIGTGNAAEGRNLAASHLDAWITTSDDPSTWRSAGDQFARAAANGRSQVRVVHHVTTVEASAGDLQIASSGRSLIEHAETLAADAAAHGLLIELDQWSATAVDALADLVRRLESSGSMLSVADRCGTW